MFPYEPRIHAFGVTKNALTVAVQKSNVSERHSLVYKACRLAQNDFSKERKK